MPTNPTPRADELPREFHIRFNPTGEPAWYQRINAGGFGMDDIGPDIGPEGFRVEYSAANGKRWRISAEPITSEPVDERTIGQQNSEQWTGGDQSAWWPGLPHIGDHDVKCADPDCRLCR